MVTSLDGLGLLANSFSSLAMSGSWPASRIASRREARAISQASWVESQNQQCDHRPAGVSGRQGVVQGRPGAGVGGAREQGFAVDEVSQGLRFAAQRADQMMIIDRVAARAIRPHARHAHDRVGPEETFQPVVEETHFDPVSDQPGRDGIEDLSTLMVLLRVTFADTVAKSVVRRLGRGLSVSRSTATAVARRAL